jgi:hypothetical protein
VSPGDAVAPCAAAPCIATSRSNQIRFITNALTDHSLKTGRS